MAVVSWLDLCLCLIFYAFLGWLVEVCWCAATRRQFYNRGLLSMPLILSYGVTFALLILLLPTLESTPLQLLLTLVTASAVEGLADWLTHRAVPKAEWAEIRPHLFSGSWKGLLFSCAIADIYYLVYLVGQPLLQAGLLLIPRTVKLVFAIIVAVLAALDFATALTALRSRHPEDYQHYQERSGWAALAGRLTAAIWKRFDKAYPGIRDVAPEELGSYTFAKGLCLDKLIWVFLISSLLGDLIEMLYCRLVGGAWMSRSSVLYGPFSFVWGLGGLLFTVLLHRLAGKSDRYVFLGGFVIGGMFEYACSVFTELVFGTVFWDYSHMPLNIGGRTNVLFCFFWGVLAVVWVKVIYPPLSDLIEKLPALAGKTLTWAILLFMLCNADLTTAAMVRFNTRPLRPESANAFEAFLDRRYDDAFMAARWPNMAVVAPQDEPPALPS